MVLQAFERMPGNFTMRELARAAAAILLSDETRGGECSDADSITRFHPYAESGDDSSYCHNCESIRHRQKKSH
jgi:hypothetical protein